MGSDDQPGHGKIIIFNKSFSFAAVSTEISEKIGRCYGYAGIYLPEAVLAIRILRE
jgi:hypothetical protein